MAKKKNKATKPPVAKGYSPVWGKRNKQGSDDCKCSGSGGCKCND